MMDSDHLGDQSHQEATKKCIDMSFEGLVTIETDAEFDFLKAEIKRRVKESGQEFVHEQWWTAGIPITSTKHYFNEDEHLKSYGSLKNKRLERNYKVRIKKDARKADKIHVEINNENRILKNNSNQMINISPNKKSEKREYFESIIDETLNSNEDDLQNGRLIEGDTYDKNQKSKLLESGKNYHRINKNISRKFYSEKSTSTYTLFNAATTQVGSTRRQKVHENNEYTSATKMGHNSSSFRSGKLRKRYIMKKDNRSSIETVKHNNSNDKPSGFSVAIEKRRNSSFITKNPKINKILKKIKVRKTEKKWVWDRPGYPESKYHYGHLI